MSAINNFVIAADPFESPPAQRSKSKKSLSSLIVNGLFLIAAATLGGPVHAQTAITAPPPLPSDSDFFASPHLLGDWGGLRTSLHDQGYDFQLGYVSESVNNWTGGTQRRIDDSGQFQLGTTLDLQHIFGLPDATFQVTIVERNGRNLSADANLGALQLVNEVYGRGDVFRLTQFWYDQKFLNGGLDVKLGRLTVGEDFFAFSCDFINLSFCGGQPGNIVGNYIFNWPVSQWAGRAKANIPNFGYVEVGAYEVNPKFLDENPGVALAPSFPNGATGVMIPVEIAWLPTFGKLGGSYKFGAWYDTSTADDVFFNTQGQPIVTGNLPPQRDQGRYGGYINFQQQLTADPTGADPKHGLFSFFNATFVDKRTSTIDRQITGGFLYHGPFDSRPNDDIGLAVGTTHINARVAEGEAIANSLGTGQGFTQSGELESEVFYGLQANGWLNLKGSLQYIHNPGGTNAFRDAIVSGVRVTITF
jgi:porin